jgi:hypothetical protein
MWEMKEEAIQKLHRTDENVEKIRNLAHPVEILKQLQESMSRKRPELWFNDLILHHDNAGAHKALSLSLSLKKFLARESITEMEHPPYSPDVAPNDFWPFQNKFCHKRDEDFTLLRTLKKKVTTLKSIPQHDFQNVSNSSITVGLHA